jgi:demethylmenaquinone methyltransferase/2-methoxy-6-polyprenyl-1,4-benzoquinol methylase
MIKYAKPKEVFVEELFSAIAPKYDFLNSLLSFGIHKAWRAYAIKCCRLSPGDSALDVAAGTCDLSIRLARQVESRGRVVAVDFCRPMLEVGKKNLERLGIKNIEVLLGNAKNLPLEDGTFKASISGFALRNVDDIPATIREMARATAPGGRVVLLELAKPEGPVFSRLYNFYFERVLPLIGGVISRKLGPYKYLPASLKCFCSREEIVQMMIEAGLHDVKVHNLTGGICAVHVGVKE